MTVRPGLTLVELLLALAMLASLTVVGIDWTVTATRVSTQAGDTARWNAAARAALDRIAEDLLEGDFAVSDKHVPRVWVDEQQLSISTRDGSTVLVSYDYDSETRTLRRRTRGQAGASRLLLGQVAFFECSAEPVLDEADPSAPPTTAILTIIIRHDPAHELTRKILIPAEWLP